MPDLVQIHKRLQNQDVVFISLALDSVVELPRIEAVTNSAGVAWPVAYGARSTATSLGVDGVPTYLVCARNGRVAYSSHNHTRLEEVITRQLSQGVP